MSRTASQALRWAAVSWFTAAIAGQLIFAFYVALLYGRTPPEAWNKVMPHGHVPGDTVGNLAVAAHLLLAVIITVGGCLQLLPAIRQRAPVLHRWVGRVYIGTAFLISLGGLFMVWTRGTVGGLTQHISISINAVVIMLCAAAALHYARRRQFDAHRRWALRLFLVSSGVWFFRIGLMLWLVIHRRPAGFDPQTFTGPFLTFLAFAQFLVPLAMLELYLLAVRRGGAGSRFAMAGLLVVLTLATAAGVAAAAWGMWLPRLRM